MIPRLLLTEVVGELGPLADHLVFTGGATVWLYLEHVREAEIRPTDDADAVVAVASYVQYSRLLDRLRERGIGALAGQSGPTCRVQTPCGHILDVMPTRREILGFGNPWFEEGVRRAIPVDLGPETRIKVFPATVFFASKVAAYLDRGQADPWTSDDLHDLLFLLDGRPSLRAEARQESPDLRRALADFARHLLGLPVPDEVVAGHLGAWAPGWRQRIREVLGALEALAEAGPSPGSDSQDGDVKLGHVRHSAM